MTPAEIIAADVAARYGVAVCPSVVQVCPPSVFAASLPVWDGRINRLVYPDAADRKKAREKAFWAGAQAARRKARDPEVAARRAEVLDWHGHGLCVRKIAEKIGISYDTSLKDHRALGLQPNAYVTSAMTQSAVRSARVAELHAQGWTARRIADLLGVAVDTVRELALKHHGLRFARYAAPPKTKVAKRVRTPKTAVVTLDAMRAAADQRRGKVVALILQGQTLAQIAKALGVTDRQVRRDCRAAGIEPLRAGRRRDATGVAA